jgi:DNA-binding phage protein
MGRLQTAEKAKERRGLEMALTRDFRQTIQARVQRDPTFRKGLLSDAVENLLAGEVALGKEILRDYINATIGFPKLAEHTGIHAKTLHQMFGPKGNPTARNLFEIVAYLAQAESIRFQVQSTRAALRRKTRPLSQSTRSRTSIMENHRRRSLT